MKILYTSAQIKRAITKIFSTSKGRRVAIAAFVGQDATAYLPRPDGIELVCWPKAGGTNPDAIRDLMKRKVSVSFANGVHMKVYWTEDRGVVLTSANLSANALCSGSLKEIGVLMPSSAININKALAALNAHPASTRDMDKLDREHKAYVKANPQIRTRMARGCSFRNWYLMANRPKWRIAWYQVAKVRLAQKARKILENEHGAHDYWDIMTATKGQCEENDWILCFNVEGRVARWAEWMFAHHVIRVPPSDRRAYVSGAPYQVIQVFRTAAYSQPPFVIDTKFRRALRDAIADLGGLESIEKTVQTKVTREFARLLYSHYK